MGRLVCHMKYLSLFDRYSKCARFSNREISGRSEVLFLELLSFSTSSALIPIDGFQVGQHPLVVRLMKGVFNSRPPRTKIFSNLEGQSGSRLHQSTRTKWETLLETPVKETSNTPCTGFGASFVRPQLTNPPGKKVLSKLCIAEIVWIG